MGLLLDCLKRREGWPEQFIKALESLEHKTLAAELRAEYDALKGDASKSATPLPTSVYFSIMSLRAGMDPMITVELVVVQFMFSQDAENIC